ncbi:MAG TPA: D-aminoacyl-tRNA deacylase [Bacteriovoracaceae bacterium]|nr:D-aminoacyl-tRNA deacylase [Bacteriovoracaceae bacterium]
MKVLIQRVSSAKVTVENEIVGEIKQGLLLFVCFEKNDTDEALSKAVDKISKLRIFDDENGRLNFDIKKVQGQILSVSQFTLSWDGSGGHRPSFENSETPQTARLKYALFNKMLRDHGIEVQEGRFGADMKVALVNDGPVTFLLNF